MKSFFIYLLACIYPFVVWAQSEEKITLRLMDWAQIEELKLTQKTIDEFHKKYPHLKVVYEPVPYLQYESKILTAFAANTPPDVFLLDSKLIPSFTNKKVLLGLDDYAEKLNIDVNQWYQNVLNIARRNNHLYAFPKGFTPLIIYFNKKLFDEANVAYPHSHWSWEDYLNIAEKLTRDVDGDGKIDQFGTAFSNFFYYWIPWIWSAGGDVVSPDGMQATNYLNSERTESAFEFLIALRKKHQVAPETGSWVQEKQTGAIKALFINHKIAMMIDGHWRMPEMMTYINEGKLDLGVVGLPGHPSGKKVNVMYESGWCVPANTRHPQEAVLLAAFMAGEAANRIRAEQRLDIPSVIKVAQELAQNDELGIEKSFLEEVPYCRQPWGTIIERFTELERVFQDAVDNVMLNQQPMHETMTTFAKRVDKLLLNIHTQAEFEFKPIKEHSQILYFLVSVTFVVFALTLVLYFLTRQRYRKSTATGMFFLAPSVLHLVVFIFTPILFAAYLSLHRWDIIVADKPFVGLDNFQALFADHTFWNALLNTAVYSLNVPMTMGISLIIALMLHKKLKGIGFFRALYFLPSVTSFVAISLVWMWIYEPSFGLANYLLSLVGLPPLKWLNATETAMISIIIFSIWLNLGYQMVIFLAGLHGIPQELYEVAKIDGVDAWRQFWKITFPLLKPTTFFVLVTSLIGSFQVFTPIFMMTKGGPVGSTDVLVYHIYETAWEGLNMGYAAAMSWILFFIVMLATWIQFKLMGKSVEYA